MGLKGIYNEILTISVNKIFMDLRVHLRYLYLVMNLSIAIT
jgi:hypothetical protein